MDYQLRLEQLFGGRDVSSFLLSMATVDDCNEMVYGDDDFVGKLWRIKQLDTEGLSRKLINVGKGYVNKSVLIQVCAIDEGETEYLLSVRIPTNEVREKITSEQLKALSETLDQIGSEILPNIELVKSEEWKALVKKFLGMGLQPKNVHKDRVGILREEVWGEGRRLMFNADGYSLNERKQLTFSSNHFEDGYKCDLLTGKLLEALPKAKRRIVTVSLCTHCQKNSVRIPTKAKDEEDERQQMDRFRSTGSMSAIRKFNLLPKIGFDDEGFPIIMENAADNQHCWLSVTDWVEVDSNENAERFTKENIRCWLEKGQRMSLDGNMSFITSLRALPLELSVAHVERSNRFMWVPLKRAALTLI